MSRASLILAAPALLGAAFGWLIWALSPWLTGEVEPWDSIEFYFVATAAAGLVASLAYPRGFWLAAAGVVAGQAAYAIIAYHPPGPAIMPAVISVPLFGAPPAFAGACVAFLVYLAVRKAVASRSS